MIYTLAALLMIAAALVGLPDVIGAQLHNRCTPSKEIADQRASHLITNQECGEGDVMTTSDGGAA